MLLTGTLGRTVGALLGDTLGSELDDGAVVGIPLTDTYSGNSEMFGRVIWLDMVPLVVGSKSCNILAMKSGVSTPNRGSSIGQVVLHVTYGIQYVSIIPLPSGLYSENS